MSAGRPAHRRLFFALWPSEAFRAELEAATFPIAHASGGHLIPSRNFHVTLLFLGEIPNGTLPAIQQAAAGLMGSPAFALDFDGIESWGRKVLCLTASTPPAAAIDLAERLRASLNNRPNRLDDRPYRPHITLARDLPRGLRRRKIPGHETHALRQQVNDFALVESGRDADSTHYAILERWPLQ